MRVKHNLEPIYNEKSKVLILGSMPSVISREEKFYYANKTNRFWKIMESLFNIHFKNNDEKKKFLLKNKIAIWDTIKECDIDASKDSSITNIITNDIDYIIKNSKINKIFCTGKTSYNIFKKYIKIDNDIEVYCLPSPSSANAKFKLEDLILEYKIIKNNLY